MIDAERLMRWTTTYHDFGVHRTGTKPDLDTAAWFFGELETMGATTDRRQIVFDRYDATVELVDVNGEPIVAEPVFYEYLGRVMASSFEIHRVEPRTSGRPRALDEVLAESSGPFRVLCMDAPPGCVRMPNRPIGECDRSPAIVIASHDVGRLDGAKVTMDAQLVPAICEASSATIGEPGTPPITVTTPLSGWYGCASERGTGAAVALDLVEWLAENHHVTVVACSGHELDHLGLRVWLDDAVATGVVPQGPVVHLGASIAALDPDPEGGTRWAQRAVRHNQGDLALDELVSPAGFVVEQSQTWAGEGGTWREVTDAPVLSIAGGGWWFHTAADTPESATSVEALRSSAQAVRAATSRFIDHVGRGGGAH